jgi:hypothetical protein
MQLSKRLFSHPVLKSNKDADYISSFFQLVFQEDEILNDKEISFKNIQYISNSSFFRNLVGEKLVKVYVRFECSKTLYQKTYDITENQLNISIDKNELEGTLTISSFAVADYDIPNFHDEDFSDLYDNTTFYIDKYDIIAFDDGYSINIIHDVESDSKVSSIFLVIPIEDTKETNIKFYYTSDKIVISLPQKTYLQYERINKIPRYKNTFFSLFAIPILANSLDALKTLNFDEIDVNYKWFISVMKRYKELNSIDLDEESFKALNSYEFAQKVFENAVVNAIDEMFNEGTIITEGEEYEI